MGWGRDFGGVATESVGGGTANIDGHADRGLVAR